MPKGWLKPTIALNDRVHIGDVIFRTFSLDLSNSPWKDFKGSLVPTGHLIDKVERAGSEWLEEQLTGKHASVGYIVEFEHKTWPKVGGLLKTRAEVVDVGPRRVEFKVTLRNENGELIGHGKHIRALVRYE